MKMNKERLSPHGLDVAISSALPSTLHPPFGEYLMDIAMTFQYARRSIFFLRQREYFHSRRASASDIGVLGWVSYGGKGDR